jgi:hypothetical protein
MIIPLDSRRVRVTAYGAAVDPISTHFDSISIIMQPYQTSHPEESPSSSEPWLGMDSRELQQIELHEKMNLYTSKAIHYLRSQRPRNTKRAYTSKQREWKVGEAPFLPYTSILWAEPIASNSVGNNTFQMGNWCQRRSWSSSLRKRSFIV